MSDLLQAPSSPPPPSSLSSSLSSSWAARLAVVRTAVTPGRAIVAVVGVVAAVAFGLIFLRTPSPPAALVLPKAGDSPPANGSATAAPGSVPGSGVAASSSSGSVAGVGASTGVGGTGSGAAGGGVGIVTAHAAGQVAAPGVYSIPAGARVADLVTAAGGLLPEADIDRLNLAARVVDGTRVYIPRRGESPPPEAGAGDAGAPAIGGGAAAPSGPVDLNTATAAQLDTLPGVGPATAAAILTYRARHGRFKSVTELLEVPGIGPAKLEAIRPLVVAS